MLTFLCKLNDTRIKQKGTVDLNEWYNHAVFDIIADVVFGEPFDTLGNSIYRPWIYLLGKIWKVITLASAVKSMAPSVFWLRRLIPTGSMLQKEVDEFDLILDRAKERITQKTEGVDFLSLIVLHDNEEEKMTPQEIIANAALFVAGLSASALDIKGSVNFAFLRDVPGSRSTLEAEINAIFLPASTSGEG